jgi:hypothetical protein
VGEVRWGRCGGRGAVGRCGVQARWFGVQVVVGGGVCGVRTSRVASEALGSHVGSSPPLDAWAHMSGSDVCHAVKTPETHAPLSITSSEGSHAGWPPRRPPAAAASPSTASDPPAASALEGGGAAARSRHAMSIAGSKEAARMCMRASGWSNPSNETAAASLVGLARAGAVPWAAGGGHASEEGGLSVLDDAALVCRCAMCPTTPSSQPCASSLPTGSLRLLRICASETKRTRLFGDHPAFAPPPASPPPPPPPPPRPRPRPRPPSRPPPRSSAAGLRVSGSCRASIGGRGVSPPCSSACVRGAVRARGWGWSGKQKVMAMANMAARTSWTYWRAISWEVVHLREGERERRTSAGRWCT